MAGSIGTFLSGLAFAGGGVLFWWFEKRKRDVCTAKVDGVVKSIGHSVSYKNGRGRDRYRTTFAYSVEGADYVKESNTTTGRAQFSEGQTVTVFYDPSKPQRFYVSEEGRIIAIPAILVGFGVAIMLLGFFV